MRIITHAVLDIETLRWLSREGYDYSGPVELCKGDSTAKAAEVQQNTFDAQLMQIFQAQYGTQSKQLAFLQGQLEPQIKAGGIGYTPIELASMRTGATDANAQQFQNAQAALNNNESQASGGSKLTGVSGANTEAEAGLLNAEAQAQAGSQKAITVQNAQLRDQNYWQSINALNGVSAQENPLGYSSSATSGSGAVAGLSQAYTASNQSQLLGALGGVASGVGSVIGGKLAGCWIAASFYGWTDIRTWYLRIWLNSKAPKWFRNFYLSRGERIAKTPFRWAFRPVFEYLLGVI